MEDGPLKPNPDPVHRALQALADSKLCHNSLQRVCLLGDTVDDMRAAVSAGIIGIGVLTPGDSLV
jgi:phosphoglycolate phosphatase-like HAD superfamily hydrolase